MANARLAKTLAYDTLQQKHWVSRMKGNTQKKTWNWNFIVGQHYKCICVNFIGENNRATGNFVMSIINSLNLVCISGQQVWNKDEHQTNSQSVIFTTHLPNISWEKYTFGALRHNTPYAIHGNTQLCWN